MAIVVPDSAASTHGPNPASYWRSSSWEASDPVKATLATSVSCSRVTDTSVAPWMVCLASSATRNSVWESSCSPSMILLSSAKAARGSRDGSVPTSRVDTADSASAEGLGGSTSRQPHVWRRRPLTSEELGREHRQPPPRHGQQVVGPAPNHREHATSCTTQTLCASAPG